MPVRPPSLARGRAVCAEQCAACHGAAGHGDGPKAAHLEGPHPADLADPATMSGLAPLDIYRKVTIGVAGTPLPPFEEKPAQENRGAAAAHLPTPPQGRPPPPAAAPAPRPPPPPPAVPRP